MILFARKITISEQSIPMLSKNQIKYLRSLQQKKTREELGLFVAEGEKTVTELFRSPFIEVAEVYALEEWIRSNEIPGKVITHVLSPAQLGQVSSLSAPQPVLAVARIPFSSAEEITLKKELVIALDEVRDPGNMGTIIRIADWFGISLIVCSGGCVDAFNPKVVQSTMGSIGRVRIYHTDLARFLDRSVGDGATVYGALLKGQNIYSASLSIPAILLMGNESKGISPEVLKYVSRPVTIPSFGNAESLNVAVATAILCSEFRRVLSWS
jgi:RNA methyltransferase, TrmH family